MIHANRIVTVGEQESIIDRPIILYRGDREVEIEFTLVGNEFMFSEEGNVIKSVNASHGQLVLNTPSGEHMFSELAECHEGKVVFVVTKEMIDEFVEMGFYSFQIRLYDSAEMKSRVTIPPVMNGFDIRNPIAAEDETNAVDQGIVDYARIFKDQSNEELPTFDWQDNYVKTEWAHHDVITENKLNKIEDALYSINTKAKASDTFMLNTLDNVKKDADTYIKEHVAEVEANAAEFERNLNTDVQKFKIDTNAAMTAHKNEVSEVVDGFDSQLTTNTIRSSGYINVKEFGAKGDGVTDDYDAIQQAIDYAQGNNGSRIVFIPAGTYYVSQTLRTINSKSPGYDGIIIRGAGYGTVLTRYNERPDLSTISATEDNIDVLAEEPVLAIHSNYNIIEDISFRFAKVGLYLGQDPRDDVSNDLTTYASYNKFKNIRIMNCGTGILVLAGHDTHYNNFNNLRITEGTIGVDARRNFNNQTSNTTRVFNRNNFRDSEISKMYCGIVLLNGDTNTIDGVHFEGIGIAYGTKPSWLPNNTHTACYLGYQLNSVINCHFEGNNMDIVDEGYGNNFINNYSTDFKNKVKLDSNTSRIGTVIGSGAGGQSNYYKIGGIYYQPDSMFSEGNTWANVLVSDLYDEGYPLTDLSWQTLNYMSPKPLKHYNDTVFAYKKIGGIKYVWLKIAILMSEENANKDIILTLPLGASTKLSQYAYRLPYRFPVIVDSSIVIARFNNSSSQVIIPKPSYGWNAIDEVGRYSHIDLQLVYF